jgi:hypothetical protein
LHNFAKEFLFLHNFAKEFSRAHPAAVPQLQGPECSAVRWSHVQGDGCFDHFFLFALMRHTTQTIVDAADAAFCTLPAPTTSARQSQDSGSQSQAPVDMSMYATQRAPSAVI